MIRRCISISPELWEESRIKAKGIRRTKAGSYSIQDVISSLVGDWVNGKINVNLPTYKGGAENE